MQAQIHVSHKPATSRTFMLAQIRRWRDGVAVSSDELR